MSLTLRDYQTECVDELRAKLRSNRNVLLQAPTGAGKTAMAAFMLDRVSSGAKRGFFICHRKELIDQTAKTLDKYGIKYGYIANGYPKNFYEAIQICSIDTLKNRLDQVPVPDFCIWDEAHHTAAAGWAKVHEYYDKSFHVGLSATPSRLDGKGLGDYFDAIVLGPPVAWLIKQGFLARYKLYSIPGVDMTGIATRMGDYIKSETSAAMDKPAITGNIVSHWKKYARGKLTIGFASSIQHSQHICAQFMSAGINAVHLDGNTEKAERRKVLQRFARGEIKIVFNVGLFAEGFDIAANSGVDVTVGCVIDAAPTMALGAWLQRCGRALRPQDGYAIILDHSGNTKHGWPCDERSWSLDGSGYTAPSEGDEAACSIKQCPKCYRVHKPASECPECGHVYEIKVRKIEEAEGELEEIDIEAVRREQRAAQGQTNTAIEMIEKLGYSEGRAAHILKARQDKQHMQTELYNLAQGAKMIGARMEFQPREIKSMKPKALRENIKYLQGVLSG